MLLPGDRLPTLRAPGNSNPDYVLDTAAGRYLLLADLTGAGETMLAMVMDKVKARRAWFDDDKLSFFGIAANDAGWKAKARDALPGVRWLFDPGDIAPHLKTPAGASWILLDPMMRVLATAPLDQADRMLAVVDGLPAPQEHGGIAGFAPVLILPRVFEPDFCGRLMQAYETEGGQPSGFMREVDGVTRLFHDNAQKRRSDLLLPEGALQDGVRARISRRLVPEIDKAFQLKATRIERYLVAAYDSQPGGWFRPHRDNTTKGTAHRRFAVSVNLYADFDGGDLRFPEFGDQTYRPPPGGACVFSCSLLHEATPVLRGRRYAFLPFLYDEAAAGIRASNLKFVELSAPALRPNNG